MRDNGLIVRLVAPGLRILFLGATAQSNYALSGLMTDLDASYLEADIVQIVGTYEHPFPSELAAVLQRASPAWLIVTPAALSVQQRKARLVPVVLAPPVPIGLSWQTIQTSQMGTVEMTHNDGIWNVNTM